MQVNEKIRNSGKVLSSTVLEFLFGENEEHTNKKGDETI